MFNFDDFYLRQIPTREIARPNIKSYLSARDLFLQTASQTKMQLLATSWPVSQWGACPLAGSSWHATLLFGSSVIEEFTILKWLQLYLVLVICLLWMSIVICVCIPRELQCVVTELKGVLWNICGIHLLRNLYLSFESSLWVIYSIVL